MFILRKVYAFLVDTIQSILIAAAIFLVIYLFLFRPFQVNGESMFPNFQDKEYVLTNLIILRFHTPVLGDVIVFQAPPEPDKDFIKRVIGLPGDTVMLKDGDVYVNGKKLDESSFLNSSVKSYGGSFLKEGDTVTVPQNEYFVMGDNRPYSSDSREWGFVPKGNIIGESMFVYWPVNDMKSVKNPYTN
ncbi:MAG TPA: signal peptidase I [Patescibacteria group bacterium]|nr:signal peptidase I [Patescibacteria group bacterium]